jgi:HSP20 family protein
MVTSKEKTKAAENKDQSHGNGGAMTTPRHGAMTHYGGYDPLFRFREEFNRLFDQFWPGSALTEFGRQHGWGLDWQEDDSAIHVRAEAPGFEAGDFDVQVRGAQLVMCACHESKSEADGGRKWEQHEFHRTFMLPSGVDAEHVEAEYRNGILSVKVPKTAESKGRKISVKG